jgi:2-oxoglutarate ferredoxin oxidoreductase subunit gamma
MNKTERVTLAGFGGQGVMMIGQILAYAGNHMGLNSLWFPSYGPETRGGTANCAVTIAQETINSPVFSQADSLIVLNRPSLIKFRHKVQENGILLYNASMILEPVEVAKVRVYGIPMHEIAEKLGNPKVANMVMLGAYLQLTSIFTLDAISYALKKVLGEEKGHLVALNLQAIQAGKDFISQQ